MKVIGIDEAGRGSLAGPVVVAAVVLPKGFYPRAASLPRLKDSKALSPTAREGWFRYINSHPDIFYTTARVYPRGVERRNVSNAANLAAKRAFERLVRDAELARYNIFLDGSLYIGRKGNMDLPAKTLIRGDQKIVAIKLASIAAKVTRDKYMVRLHKRYPEYSFDLHKGYGTELHRKMLHKHGPSAVHRETFLQKI